MPPMTTEASTPAIRPTMIQVRISMSPLFVCDPITGATRVPAPFFPRARLLRIYRLVVNPPREVPLPHIDYSHRSLLDKLNVKEDGRVLLVGDFTADFPGDIARRAHVLSSTRAAAVDLIFLLADDTKTLLRV